MTAIQPKTNQSSKGGFPSLSHVVYIGENNAIIVLHESTQTEILIQRIQMGLWEPPFQVHRGPFQAIRKGETLIVTPIQQNEPLHRRMCFTQTEARILRGLASGMSDEQLAMVCDIKPRTVRFYVSRLKDRLQAHTREHLVAKAGMLGLYDSSTVGLDN
jgi:DNA-binding CsgD family transcriptional regulator